MIDCHLPLMTNVSAIKHGQLNHMIPDTHWRDNMNIYCQYLANASPISCQCLPIPCQYLDNALPLHTLPIPYQCIAYTYLTNTLPMPCLYIPCQYLAHALSIHTLPIPCHCLAYTYLANTLQVPSENDLTVLYHWQALKNMSYVQLWDVFGFDCNDLVASVAYKQMDHNPCSPQAHPGTQKITCMCQMVIFVNSLVTSKRVFTQEFGYCTQLTFSQQLVSRHQGAIIICIIEGKE